MKLEKNILIAISFLVTLGLLVALVLFTVGFDQNLKYLIGAVYFAFWVAALVYLAVTFILPYIKERKKAAQEAKNTPKEREKVQRTADVTAPRSNLPLRERIATYVAERRREEGLPAPEPLVPSRSAGTSPSSGLAGAAPAIATGAGIAAATLGAAAAVSDNESEELPLPDDLDLAGSDDFTLDDGGMAETGGGDEFDDFSLEETPEETGSAEPEDLGLPDLPAEEEEGGLPDIDEDLSADFTDEDLDGQMLDTDTETLEEPEEGPAPEEEGGLSEDGLGDLGDTLDTEMLDSDFPDDISDIEFTDIEPEDEK